MAYLPKPSDLKNNNDYNKSLSFTIIDCSQDSNKTKTTTTTTTPLSTRHKEFTFEARNLDEKKSWQTGIVMCMLATHNNQNSKNNKNTLSKKFSISTENNFKNAINATRANRGSSSMSLAFSSSFLSSFKLNQNNYDDNSNNNTSRGSMLRKTLTSKRNISSSLNVITNREIISFYFCEI